MNKRLTSTARHKGAVGPNAVLPRYIAKYANKRDYILDYGSGYNAIHTQALQKQGFNVWCYDISGVDNNITKRISNKTDMNFFIWDIVFASNVLNVQYKYSQLETFVANISVLLTEQNGVGQFICNYPKSPRKMPHISTDQMQVILGGFFHSVKKVGKSYSPIFICENKGIIEREI